MNDPTLFNIQSQNSSPCCNPQLEPGQITMEFPEFWGPRMWFILYYFVYKIQTNDQLKIYFEILNKLNIILPCSICNNHVSEYMKREPLPELENQNFTNIQIVEIKNKLFLWLRKLQNIIRFNNKKEILNFTLDSLENYYENNKIKDTTFKNLYFVLIIKHKQNPELKSLLNKWMKNVEELRFEFSR